MIVMRKMFYPAVGVMLLKRGEKMGQERIFFKKKKEYFP